ncbi:MAG: hypothetical protein ACLR9W_02560 [Enterobacter hormaechei]
MPCLPEPVGTISWWRPANPLLNAIPQIRHSVSHDDQVGLRQRLIDEIRRFEVRASRRAYHEVIVGARVTASARRWTKPPL